MSTNHSLDSLKRRHSEATQFFGSELLLLEEAISKITDERLGKAAVLLMSCRQTGAALLQLASQTDRFNSESTMLARSFMEKMTNFCYVGICNEQEYQAFILHPVYKHFHNVAVPKMEDDLELIAENAVARKEKQNQLRKIPIVQEALALFSETNPRLNWTRKTLAQRIEAIEKWGKLFDVFFTINKIQYYSDASEALHGSLYGCTYSLGLFTPDFDHTNPEELNKSYIRKVHAYYYILEC